MEIAGLVLEYIKVLIWPLTAASCVLIFKDQIFKLISKITELNLEAKGIKLRLQLSKKILEAQSDIVPQIAESTEPQNNRIDPSILWEMPDNDFMFLDDLSNRDLLDQYYPISKEEEYRFNSLVNDGYFTKQDDSKFSPTDKGREIIKHMKKF